MGKSFALKAVSKIDLQQGSSIFERALQDRSEIIVAAGVRVLAQSTNRPEVALPLLLNAAKSIPSLSLASGLGAFGTNAQAGVPLLLQMLEGTDGSEQMQVARALYKIDPATAMKAGWTLEKLETSPPPRRRGRGP